ncbi:hypothetical protein OGAPHI_003526 [Ogataea philodendri]|uniref:Uncharacterized protein n=1 Tax=Ogataea philodendri TaxID=1378263 RepID=A0A9P8T5P3_9ASCO|nr:uncharacterized protein OGAPHI_003526 [Ogataea philodendri]KAH3666529.1 hypothetical protein OGAPHI_003526 [Ogataea philodendri]
MISKLPKSSLPYYKQLLAFDEYLSHNCTFDLKKGEVIGDPDLFWESVYKVMPLYEKLSTTGEIDDQRMDSLISMLRNGLRMYRFELSKQKKNFDKDSSHSLKNHKFHLSNSLKQLTDEILRNPTIGVSAAGVANLFKAYKDLEFVDEAVNFWEKGKEIPRLKPVFNSETVLGSVIQFLVDTGDFDLSEVDQIYDQIKKGKSKIIEEEPEVHSELMIGMIKAYLAKGDNERAGNLFKQITTDVCKEYEELAMDVPPNVLSYMTKAHFAFVCYSTDTNTADMFFESAAKGQLPYPTPLLLSFIKPYMLNSWVADGSLTKVRYIWEKTWLFNEKAKRSNSSISSSLNDLFFKIFFAKYPKCDAEGVQTLKNVIKSYSNIRAMDEPFFNCLLVNSSVWANTKVFKTILKAADLYNFQKTNVFYRCCLKSSGAVNLQVSEVHGLVESLLNSNVALGYKKIANADWLAIRDATINSENPTNQKIDYYFKLWKVCSPYFAEVSNYSSYQRADIKLNKAYAYIYKNIREIDASEIQLPQLDFFTKDESLEQRVS